MYNIFISSSLAFLVTFFGIPVIIKIAKDKKLFDEPDERKVHKAVIPTLGGLGIFGGFILAALMGVPNNSSNFQYFIAAIMVIFFLGVKDDILLLSASKKFIGQLIAAGIIIKFGGIQLTNMHGFLGFGEIPRLASLILTTFTIIVITNSFNLIDGVDGLAGSLGLLTSTVFGSYFLITGQLMYAVMGFSLAGSLLAFLIYNFSPAKIFMGDTGSLLLGLLNAVFVIRFIDSTATSSYPIYSAPAIGFSILIVPLFDTMRVFSLRIIKRRSPFSPDRNHIHHFLLDFGLSHKMITLVCVTVNILFIALAYNLRGLGTSWVLLAVSLTAIIFVGIVYYNKPKGKYDIDAENENANIIKSHKIYSVVAETADQD